VRRVLGARPVRDYVAALRAAVAAFRAGGGREHLDLLFEFGDRRVAHALSMERAYQVLDEPENAAPYTATIEAWLDPPPGPPVRRSSYRLGGH
jgi:hypothetical protein